nr:hypothetical protein [Natronococcus pandeyae]
MSSSGAMVVGATAATTVDEHDTDAGEDETEVPDEESDEEQDETAEGETDDADEVPDDEPDEQQPAHVTFEDQESDGESVVVDEVSMVDGGFVTIHDSSLLAGDALGSVIGVSEFLEEGTHEDVEVALDEPLEEAETLIAMPHRDTNDNQEYDFVETEGEEDGPYLTADDEPVTDEAVVTLEEELAEEPVEEEPVDEPVEEEPVDEPEEPVEEEPVEEEPVDDEPVEEEPEAVDEDAISILIERADIFTYVEGLDEMPGAGEMPHDDAEADEPEADGEDVTDDEPDEDREAPPADHQIELTIEQPTITPIGDDTVDASEEELMNDVSIGQATVFVVVHELGEMPMEDDTGDGLTIERATIFVVVDDVQPADETVGDEAEADDEIEDEAADDEEPDADEVEDDADAVDERQITIEQATVFVVVQDGAMNGEMADDDLEENGVEDDAADDEYDADDEMADDDEAAADDELEDDADDQRLEITIEQATIFLFLDEVPVTEDPVDEPVEEEPVEEEPVEEEPVEEEPVEDEPEAAVFEVADLEPTDVTVTQGDVIDVSATITNAGEEEATQTVEFRVDGEALASEELTLGAGDSETITFEEIDTAALEPGDYTHGVFTEDTEQTATLTVEEGPADEEDADDAPAEDDEDDVETALGFAGAV